MQKHQRCESVDEHGHRCNKKVDHQKIKARKGDDPAEVAKLRSHSAFGARW